MAAKYHNKAFLRNGQTVEFHSRGDVEVVLRPYSRDLDDLIWNSPRDGIQCRFLDAKEVAAFTQERLRD